MSEAVCPACGVAVMPGYVRCPKCRKALPHRAPTAVQGGTAVDETNRSSLYGMIGAGIVIVGVVIYFVTRGGGGDKPKTVQPLVPTTEQPVAQQPTNTAVPFADDQPRVQQPTRPDPAAAAAGLERDLKRQRLWSTVTVTGNRVEVRSGSCEDPAMAPLLDAAVTDLKAAGIARMRCVEQGGRVVSDREL